MLSPLIVSCFLFFFFFPLLLLFLGRKKLSVPGPLRLPPGPRRLPIIGNLHLLGLWPHRDVAELSKAYGPILYLQLGSVPTVFVSSPLLAKQVLKDHDAHFSNRPYSEAAEFFSYGFKGFSFSEYGVPWRDSRKLCVQHFLSPAVIGSYCSMRREELVNFVEELQESATIVDLTVNVRVLVTHITCRMLMGRKLTEEMDPVTFSEHIHGVMTHLGSFSLNDLLPALRPFDLQGTRKKLKAVKEPLDKFLEQILEEQAKLGGKTKQKSFVAAMLDFMNDQDKKMDFDRINIKAILMEMFGGAMHTAPVSIEWAFVELLRNPSAMRKAQEELERVIGRHRIVDEMDLPRLPYLEMVVKESFRLHHVGPFLLHRAKDGFILDGYDIPKGTNVMVCAWGMGHDPKLWDEPEEFRPERFENISIDLRGQDFHLLPFGSGRRGCAGINFGLLMVPLVLAQLVHCFDWELSNGMSPSEMDMTEVLGLAMPRVVHLHASPTNRMIEIHGCN